MRVPFEGGTESGTGTSLNGANADEKTYVLYKTSNKSKIKQQLSDEMSRCGITLKLVKLMLQRSERSFHNATLTAQDAKNRQARVCITAASHRV
jgi:hypothetical protein